jgi:hypothetical protein
LMFLSEFASAHLFYPRSVFDTGIGLVLLMSGGLMTLGLFVRATALMTSGLLVFNVIRLPGSSFGHSHVLVLGVTIFLLALTDSNLYFSLRPHRYRHALPVRRLLILLMAVVYFWAAISKFRSLNLSGLNWMHVIVEVYTGPLNHLNFLLAPYARYLGILIALTETILFSTLLVRSWRKVSVALLFAFHGLLFVLVPVGPFSVLMMSLLTLILPIEDVENRIRLFIGEWGNI